MEGFRMNQIAKFRKVIIKPGIIKLHLLIAFSLQKTRINIVSKFLIINI